jgi:hypothetical protein
MLCETINFVGPDFGEAFKKEVCINMNRGNKEILELFLTSFIFSLVVVFLFPLGLGIIIPFDLIGLISIELFVVIFILTTLTIFLSILIIRKLMFGRVLLKKTVE